MKRILLAGLCALALLLAGCADINQNNSFAELPTPETTAMPEVTATPELTPPPVVHLEILPTLAPGTTATPAPPTPSQPLESPGEFGGFNG
jgi:hypothetical protein